jgi:hypothetical protein
MDCVSPVAIAYVMQKAPYVFPIVGGRKVEHLHANIEALSIALSDAHIAHLEGVLPFDIGFPGNLFVGPLCARRSLTMSADDVRRETVRRTRTHLPCAWEVRRINGHCSRPFVQ